MTRAELARAPAAVSRRVDESRRCTPSYTVTDFNEEIDSFYVLQAKRFDALSKRLRAREISPIRFFMEYQRMDVKDVAARVRLGVGAVRRHLTPDGFERARVGDLKRYAAVFDLSVAEFFQFVFVSEELRVEVESDEARLLQEITVSS